MAARRGRFLISCLSWQKNTFFGLIARNPSSKIAYNATQVLSRSPCHLVVARSMCSAATKLNISDEGEDYEIPKAADSHTTSSVFDNELVSKFVNCMMWDGKKSLSQTIIKKTFEEIKKTQLEKQRGASDSKSVETDPVTIFLEAVENCKPVIGVRSISRGKRVFQVPTPLPPQRRRFLAIKWLIEAARDQSAHKNTRMYQKLSKELLDAYSNEGTAIKKKRELHRRAEDNRAFAHYRWW